MSALRNDLGVECVHLFFIIENNFINPTANKIFLWIWLSNAFERKIPIIIRALKKIIRQLKFRMYFPHISSFVGVMEASRKRTIVKAVLVVVLIVLYIHFFGLTSIENYLSGDITINRKYKIVQNVKPPGTLENNPFYCSTFILYSI